MTIRRIGLWGTVGLVFLLGVLDLVQHYHTDPPAAFLMSLIRAVPLLFYRSRPVEVWITEVVAVSIVALQTAPAMQNEPWPWAVTSIAAVASAGGLVASLGRKPLSTVMLGVVTGIGLVLSIWPARGDWFAVVAMTVVCGVAIGVGDYVYGRQRIVVQLAEERQVSASERELRSVVEERARIARELHDVVAHHMSMITVQAETARYRLDGLPPEVVAEFTDIAKVARSSLSELRGLLSALRDDGADPHRTPQPTLADLEPLVARIVAAGTPVELTVVAGALPQVTQLAVYRIVQEALSNVVRHAGGARTWVDILLSADRLRVEVTNERSAGGRSPASHGGGHGLVGLRERAMLLGGTFEVDQPDGGWRVRVELPV